MLKENNLKFIKNGMDIDNNARTKEVTFKVYALYDEIQPDGYATVKTVVIDTIVKTWDEIDKMGLDNYCKFTRELAHKYNVK